MRKIEHYVQKFERRGRRLVARPPQFFKTADEARVRGLKMADEAAGVIVFAVSGEPEFDEWCAVLIARYGEAPGEVF